MAFTKVEIIVLNSLTGFNNPLNNPPIILPKNEPKPYPIFSSIGRLTFINSANLSFPLAIAPIAVISPAMAATTAIIIPIPPIAAKPNLPATPSNTHDADNLSIKFENASVIGTTVLTGS